MRNGKGRVRVAIIGAALAVSVATAATAASFTVKARSGNRWGPKHTYIGKDDKVVWKNPTGGLHDVKSIGRNWRYTKQLNPGQSVSRVFGKTGTYRYRCVRHSAMVDGKCQGMCGIVHVFNN